MCYTECISGYGIDKMIKGEKLHSDPNSKQPRKIEIRINLEHKLL